jgi:SAM-dependent methyltransferase
MLERVIALPAVQRTAFHLATLVDIQWALLRRHLAAVAPQARGRLLDVGCGQKPYLDIFGPRVTEYIGVEHESTFAETHSSTRALRPDVYYDGKRLPFDDASFDTVINIQVLEHTASPQALLHEISRVLKRDGLLIISVPFSFRLHEEPHDYFRYTPHGLASMLREAGLEIVTISAQGGLWSVVGHKLNSFLALRVARLQKAGQAVGKLGHEKVAVQSARYWTLPVVIPAMLALSGGALVLDKLIPDETESLSFLATVRHRQDA